MKHQHRYQLVAFSFMESFSLEIAKVLLLFLESRATYLSCGKMR